MRRCLLVVPMLILGAAWLAAQDQIPIPINSHSGSEPNHALVYAAMDASTKSSPANLLTTGEKTSFNQTAPYAEAVEIAHRLESASPYVRVITFGSSPEGRPMVALVVSRDKAFTPEAAHRTNKAIILIQSGIHPGEIEGKDTALMLVRDMTVTKLHADWLDSAIFVVIPVFNVDGHDRFSLYHRTSQSGPYETGTRETAQLLNLNRDYVKADTPEMRAWLQLYTTWLPDFMFDNHVTDGSDWQYDVTWDMARNQDLAEPARVWVAPYVTELDKRMAAAGHVVAPYGALRTMPSGKREFFMEVFSPRYSHLYSAVQNRPCLLIETHSWKLAKTRAAAHYDIMRDTIDYIAANPQALRQAVRASDAQMMSYGGDHDAPPIYLGGEVDDTQSEPLLFHALKTTQYMSEVTGAMVTRYLPDPDDFETVIHDKIRTTAEAQMPLGYVIPVQYKALAAELRLHNIEVDTIPKALTQEFETYRFTDVTYANSQFEGRVMVNFNVHPAKEKVTVAAGSFWVPMKQRSARLILAMLEPAAPDSLAKWGFVDQVLGGGRGGGGGGRGRAGGGAGRGGTAAAGAGVAASPGATMPEGTYVLEPLARRMMANQPALQKEFLDKVANDPAFAADPQARLQWWYDRSNYAPEDAGRYPVYRVWDKTW
jgi:murein tripeptide amidase MpaA